MDVRYFNEIANACTDSVQVVFCDQTVKKFSPAVADEVAYAPSNDTTSLTSKLEKLKDEHRRLDGQIDTMLALHSCDGMMLQRLKRKRLALRDSIQKVESLILPDIIA